MDLVTRSGPLFDGRASAAALKYAITAREAVAQEAVNRIRARLGDVLVNPTGLYEAAIHAENAADDVMVTDLPVVYGPWLEGAGKRNETTRFKGYHTFRLVSQQLDRDSAAIAARQLPPYVVEMNILWLTAASRRTSTSATGLRVTQRSVLVTTPGRRSSGGSIRLHLLPTKRYGSHREVAAISAAIR